MKKIFLISLTAFMLASCKQDDGSVTIQLPENFEETELVVSHLTIENIATAKQQDDLVVVYDTLEVKNGRATMKLDPAGPSRYNITSPVMTSMEPDFYATPGDNLEVVIKSFEPLDYSVTGTPLMEDMSVLMSMTTPIQQEYMAVVSSNTEITEDDLKTLMDRYDNAIKQFVAEHPDSHATPFAITYLDGDEFKAAYDNLSAEARKSILMPFAELYNNDVEEMISDRKAEEARESEIASGKIEAPDFTLPNLEGKKVSLSDFRGKWVVLDFWGSWCGWCIKGFPALKEAYAKYGDKIVVIGIDCNESEADWKAGVKKYELPWINVYNGDDKELYSAYNITGFPTKAIISPEGKLVALVTGEDPSFFTSLAGFLEK